MEKLVILVGLGIKYVGLELIVFLEKLKILIIYFLLVKIIVLDNYLNVFGNFGKIGIKLVYEVM